VGSAEAEPAKGRISLESPVGKALLGKHVGDDVSVVTPGGATKLLIVEVR
jgi:transcription elongation factor GreA